METRIKTILSPSDFARVSFKSNNQITVDVHGFSVNHMKYFLKNIAALIREPFKMTIIHGFNHGTSLLEAIRNDRMFYRPYEVIKDKTNPGVTHINFA